MGFGLIGIILFVGLIIPAKYRNTIGLQRAMIIGFCATFATIWTLVGIFVPTIHLQGFPTSGVTPRVLFIGFGLVVTGLILRYHLRQIAETSSNLPPEKAPTPR